MFKKILIILIIVFIGILIFGYLLIYFKAEKLKDKHCLITQLSSRLFDLNNLDVKVSEDLNIEDFKIKNINSNKIIFENNRFIKGIKNDYGNCLFEIYYKDSLIFEIGHFKFNNWHTNDYLFEFEIIGSEISSTLIIDGPDKDNKTIFYKRFDHDSNGKIEKVVYFDCRKNIYYVEELKTNK